MKLFAKSGKAQYLLTQHYSNIHSRVVSSDIRGRNDFKKRNKYVNSSPISIQDDKYWHLCVRLRPHRELGRVCSTTLSSVARCCIQISWQENGRLADGRTDRLYHTISYHLYTERMVDKGRSADENCSECILNNKGIFDKSKLTDNRCPQILHSPFLAPLKTFNVLTADDQALVFDLLVVLKRTIERRPRFVN